MHKAISLGFCALLLVGVIGATSFVSATTQSTSVGGGTLSWTITSSGGNCGYRGQDTYTEWYFGPFTYVLSGTTYNMGGSAVYIQSPGGSCPPNGPEPPGGLVLAGTGFNLNFFPYAGGGSATYSAVGILYPTYQIQSIIYDAPGNRSSNGFTASTTNGTTTSVGQSFQAGDTTTFSLSGGFLGLGSTLSWSYGISAQSGNSTGASSTITQATGVANASGGTKNAITHLQDLFILWLNPAVGLTQTGNTSVSYSLGTQLQKAGDPSPGQPEIQDQVEIFAQAMMANGSGKTTVPVAALVPQIINGQTLPGLANVCAHRISGYPTTCTQTNQCGCVPSDFTAILAGDPLINFTSTKSPLTANTSSASACTNPTATASCRYIPVMVTNGSNVQITELLAGPQTVGGNIPVNTFTQTDSTTTTETLSQSFSTTVGFSWEESWKLFGTGLALANATSFTWSNNESTGVINGHDSSMSVTFSSATLYCYQSIPVFEDTVYHTFVFQQPVGNATCP